MWISCKKAEKINILAFYIISGLGSCAGIRNLKITRSGKQKHGHPTRNSQYHYDDVIMGAMASQITSFTNVYLTVYSTADRRKHKSSASLAFLRGPVNSPHKWPVTRKMFAFDDVIMSRLFGDIATQGITVLTYLARNMSVLLAQWFKLSKFHRFVSAVQISPLPPFHSFYQKIMFTYFWNEVHQ